MAASHALVAVVVRDVVTWPELVQNVVWIRGDAIQLTPPHLLLVELYHARTRNVLIGDTIIARVRPIDLGIDEIVAICAVRIVFALLIGIRRAIMSEFKGMIDVTGFPDFRASVAVATVTSIIVPRDAGIMFVTRSRHRVDGTSRRTTRTEPRLAMGGRFGHPYDAFGKGGELRRPGLELQEQKRVV